MPEAASHRVWSNTSNGALALADQAIVSATSFLTGVIISRTSTQEQFGLYTLGFSLLVVLLDLQNRLINSPYVVYNQYLQGSELAEYRGSTFIHQLVLSATLLSGLVISGVFSAYADSTSALDSLAFALGISIAPLLLRDYLRRILFAHMRMSTALVLDAIAGLLQIGFILFLAFWQHLSAATAFIASGIASGAVALTRLKHLSRKMLFDPARARSHLHQNWLFGRWLVAGGLAFTASVQIVPWLLAFMSGVQDTAILGACLSVTFLANPVLLGLANFFGPMFANTYANDGLTSLNTAVLRAVVSVSVAMSAFCTLIFIFGDRIVVAIYGSAYADCGDIVSVLALSVFVASIMAPIDQALCALERTDANLRMNLIALGTTISVAPLLIYNLGVFGAALGLLCSNAAASSARCYIFLREIRTRSTLCA